MNTCRRAITNAIVYQALAPATLNSVVRLAKLLNGSTLVEKGTTRPCLKLLGVNLKSFGLFMKFS